MQDIDKVLFEKEKSTTHDKLAICQEVYTTTQSNGWNKTIEPLIDKMIVDTIGGKVNGRWTGGTLTDGDGTKNQDFYLGYKQFGIDLLNRIHKLYLDNIGKLKNKLAVIDDQLSAPLVVPMFENEHEFEPNVMSPVYRSKQEEVIPLAKKKKKKKKKNKAKAKAKKKAAKKRKRR